MKQLRVLVVDDSPAVRRILVRLIQRVSTNDVDVREAANGIEALAALQDSWVHLIFCDIGMPGMGGIEFVKRIRQDKSLSYIPVVMISAGGTEASVMQAVEAGAAGYLRKPFTMEQIRDYLHSPLVSAS
jgi:two-component system, chemotaxis family, chemotaxis protein CheY